MNKTRLCSRSRWAVALVPWLTLWSGAFGCSSDRDGAAPPACGGPRSVPVGRPEIVACAATPDWIPGASTPACMTDGNCADAGGLNSYCLNGQCGPDQCLADTDCAAGNACSCGFPHDGPSRNGCVPTGCRVDADCGPNGACSPTYGPGCAGVTGYWCHTAKDTCKTDLDCCGSTPACLFQPTIGAWTCQAAVGCSG
jgi:hypothetical protein